MLIVGIDIETTGFSTGICEFAAVAIDAVTGKHVFSCSSLVNPGPVQWNPVAMRVHGISQPMVRTSPSIAIVWSSFRRALLDTNRKFQCYAHNAAFERRHLGAALGTKFDLSLECSLKLSRAKVVASSHRLPVVCSELGIPFTETHRAEPDARAVALIVRKLLV